MQHQKNLRKYGSLKCYDVVNSRVINEFRGIILITHN